MQKFFVLTTQTIETETEEEAIKIAKESGYQNLPEETMIALTRENCRSNKNLLAKPIIGRFANHLSSKKIPVKDLK